MSIRQGLLALLEDRPRYGYELRQEFESRTGSTWPLNVGQVYTTLARLERDGFVEPDRTDDEGHVYYRITPAGRVEVAAWFARPVGRESSPRDELAIKLALAITLPGVDVAAMVQTQRTETMRALQEVTRLKARATQPDDLAWTLVADAMVFQAEAEIRWLDHCEARLVRAAAVRAPQSAQIREGQPAEEATR
jgi:DNA-binding PadR family transcriptional regulator